MLKFLELASEYCNPETALFHVVPIPFEGTVCFQKGTIAGPEAILSVSNQIEHLDEETLLPFYLPGIATYPVIQPANTPAEEMTRIESVVRGYDLFRPDRFPIFLGGEHSISAPLIKLAAEKYDNLTVLQFDAHSDLRDSFEEAGKYSHASAMRRALDYTPNLVQVGIRSFSKEDLITCPEQVKQFITPDLLEEHFEETLNLILSRLTENVYITFDMDAFDPSLAPGVGTPEPGGLNWRQVMKILRRVQNERKAIGADIVETMPLPNAGKNTEFIAARLATKIMTFQQRKSEKVQ